MSIARKDCIWNDQCGSDCLRKCDNYYSPYGETVEDEKYYHQILAENAQEYQKMIQDYSDGGDYCES